MIDKIVTCMNKEGERVRRNNWQKTDSIESEVFAGCLICMRLRITISPSTLLWSKTDGNNLLMACFSRDMLLNLSIHLKFDCKKTCNAVTAKDNFVPFREIWDDFNLKLYMEHILGPILTADALEGILLFSPISPCQNQIDTA